MINQSSLRAVHLVYSAAYRLAVNRMFQQKGSVNIATSVHVGGRSNRLTGLCGVIWRFTDV